jgi:hypothetical protein
MVMNINYACPKCERTTHSDFDENTTHLSCTHCGAERAVPSGAVTAGGVSRCLVCPSEELFLRKDFPQRLGVTIVAVGLAASCIPWYFHNWYGAFAILFATALIDVVLYLTMGDMLQCYRCQAQYRGIPGLDQHEAFSLETHERHRQQEARLSQARQAVKS